MFRLFNNLKVAFSIAKLQIFVGKISYKISFNEKRFIYIG